MRLSKTNGQMRRRRRQQKQTDRECRNLISKESKRRKVLSPAHMKAINFYMQGCSKKEALIKAGYSLSFAAHAAYRVFDRRDVVAEIERRRYAMSTRAFNIAERIQDEYAKIAFFNIGKVIEVTDDGQLVYNFTDVNMDDLAAIASIKVEEEFIGGRTVRKVFAKPYDKKAALDALAKMQGLFTETDMRETNSMEERLARGRQRVARAKVIEGEYEVV